VQALLTGGAKGGGDKSAADKDARKESGASPHTIIAGAYKDEGNVAALRAKLKAQGLPSYTETVGDKVRVRVGPFPNKAAAEKAAEQVQKLGVPATVVGKP
jgi:DedD protein